MKEVYNRVYPIRMSKKHLDIPIVNRDGEKVVVNLNNFNNENLGDGIVISDKIFYINISYPLLFPVKIKINKTTVTTLDELIKIIRHIYIKLYKVEEETSTKYLKINLFKCENCSEDNIVENLKSGHKNKINCSICFEKIKKCDFIQTECKHNFHKNCLKMWINSSNKITCPVCRQIVYNCKECNCFGEKAVYERVSVKPLENNSSRIRNVTDGVYGIYGHYFEDLNVCNLNYNNIKKELNIKICL